MFTELEHINSRPDPFQYYTAEALWTDDHISKRMLTFHLNRRSCTAAVAHTAYHAGHLAVWRRAIGTQSAGVFV